MMGFILTTSLICLAIHVSINWDEYVLNWSLKYLDRIPVNFIKKPLYACLPCMGSVYTIAHWFVAERPLEWGLLITLLAVVGVNTLIELFIRTIEAIENLEQF